MIWIDQRCGCLMALACTSMEWIFNSSNNPSCTVNYSFTLLSWTLSSHWRHQSKYGHAPCPKNRLNATSRTRKFLTCLIQGSAFSLAVVGVTVDDKYTDKCFLWPMYLNSVRRSPKLNDLQIDTSSPLFAFRCEFTFHNSIGKGVWYLCL